MADSPVVIPYGANSGTPTYVEVPIRTGIAVPSGQPGFMVLGSDGTNTRYLKVDATGALQTTANAAPATATLSNVAASITSVTLLASNTSRVGAMIFNDSSAVLYVKFGSSASSTSFVVRLNSNAYYELPAPCYTGIVTGIWASATGSARVTETTP